MAITSTQLLDSVRSWWKTTVDDTLQAKPRSWCLMGFNKSFTWENLFSFFDRKELNDKYKAIYDYKQTAEENKSVREPCGQIQLEINTIYSIHKCFVARHKTRLQYYRDDLSAKTRARNSLGDAQSDMAVQVAQLSKAANRK